MIKVDTNLYITGNHNIWKTDKYLKELNTYNQYAAVFRGIYFNLTERLTYVAPEATWAIVKLPILPSKSCFFWYKGI